MDLNAVLSEIRHWSPEDRLRLIEEIWDGLSEEAHDSGIADDLKDLLASRLASLEAAPDEVTTWDAIKSR